VEITKELDKRFLIYYYAICQRRFILEGEIPWGWLLFDKYENLSKIMILQAFRTTLASAYMLYHLHAAWLQFQKLKWSSIEGVLIRKSMLT